ncbi:dTMP kinase [Methanocaldococcus sp.]
MFIVFEGIDGSGKTTISKLLAKEINAYWTCEPTDGKIGLLIREKLRDKDVDDIALSLLFAADRMEHVKKIKEILKDKSVVCDRYLYSSIAYQSSSGVDESFLWEINRYALKPDVVVLLTVDIDEAMKRVEGKDIFEKKEFLKKVQDKYLELAKKFNFIVIDTTKKSIEKVFKEVLGEIHGYQLRGSSL